MRIDLHNTPFDLVVSPETIVTLRILSQSINYYRSRNRGLSPTHLFTSVPLFIDIMDAIEMYHTQTIYPRELIFEGVKICPSDVLGDEFIITKN